MSSPNDIFNQYEGQIVPRSFSAGYAVLSYLVSWVGAWTTLELINKRTAGRGIYNWFLLIGSSISMGGIAIWCMHFIGNRAIILAGGIDVLQISYNPGFTALSFFVPIFVLLAAFMAVGSNDTVSWIRVSMGGSLAGLAICGMHYLGQTGIANYTSVYKIANVVGSAVIAIIASITALAVFFVLRAAWTNSWWKRAGTAVILAGAVSGMHWLASVGTQYRLREIATPGQQNLSNNSTVIVVIVLSISACFILLTFTLIAQRRRARSANRAQQVILAAGVFDAEGRLMVTPNGELPTQKITNEYIERSFDDIFGISHPAFLWIFRTTRNWTGIASLIPMMRNHIQHTSVMKGSRSGTKSAELSLTNENGDLIEDYSIIFRELFCIAAADLAAQMGEPLESAGVLFDEILSTGQKQNLRAAGKLQKTTPQGSVDLERDGLRYRYYGRGQLLFLTRRVNKREAEQLAARGYRFANISNVINILSSSMQIQNDDLMTRLESMKEYCQETHILEPGVHMACFSIRASVNGGFDILVRRDASNQLPTMQLPLERLDSWQLEYLASFNGLSVGQCLKYFKLKSRAPGSSNKEHLFGEQLHDTLEALRDEINDPFFNDAQLVAKPVSAPCRGLGEDAVPGEALIIAFRIIVPIHSRAPGTKLDFTPLPFFKLQQHIYENSPDHAVFARAIHREFGPILSRTTVQPTDTKSPVSSKFARFGAGDKTSDEVRMELDHHLPTLVNRSNTQRSRFNLWPRKNDEGSDEIELGNKTGSSDTSSEKGLVETQTFGGIMVSQEVSVDVRTVPDGGENASQNTEVENSSSKRGKSSNNMRIGTTGVAMREDEDAETYVDKLFAVCVASR